MATGLGNKLVGQVGEFLVCAELGRRGLIATPFAGNVPEYDVIATDAELNTVPIQVKASTGGAWQFNADKILDIEFDPATGIQRVLGVRETPNLDLVYVFVALAERSVGDRFFILTRKTFLTVSEKHYTGNLERLGGRRPRRADSMHMALGIPDLEPFEDEWGLIESRLTSRLRSGGPAQRP